MIITSIARRFSKPQGSTLAYPIPGSSTPGNAPHIEVVTINNGREMKQRRFGSSHGITPLSLLMLATFPAWAATWLPVTGDVRTETGIPVCAMVLANGQYMFSCGGNGAYSLNVPLDEKGQITLFAFADGFAPFSATVGPNSFPLPVRTHTAAPGSPLISMTRAVDCSASGRVRVHGAIDSADGQPLCALVLANGQHMFSCGASQGRYDLTVPLDSNDQVTLFGFADGFQPFSSTFNGSTCDEVRYSALNDTGVTYCADLFSSDRSCPVNRFPGQDAEHGRDVTQNDDSDGQAGFSFTKLDAGVTTCPPPQPIGPACATTSLD